MLQLKVHLHLLRECLIRESTGANQFIYYIYLEVFYR